MKICGYKLLLSIPVGIGIMVFLFNTLLYDNLIYAKEHNPGLYSLDSKPFNITYGEWIAKHTEWLMSIPLDEHPGKDYTPEKCSASQSGPVWFLTMGFKDPEERICSIPSDKAILLPVLAGFCAEWETPSLLECAKAGNEFNTIRASIDGKEVNDLISYRIQSPVFNVTVPNPNVLGYTAGSGLGQNDGVFLFLEPLSPGNHTVNYYARILNPIAPMYNYVADLTYHLVIR